MARIRKFQKMLDIAKRYNGVLTVDNPELVTLLANGTGYRLASYIWDIKHYAGLTVTAVRQGRKILAYEIPALKHVVTETTETTETTEVVIEAPVTVEAPTVVSESVDVAAAV